MLQYQISNFCLFCRNIDKQRDNFLIKVEPIFSISLVLLKIGSCSARKRVSEIKLLKYLRHQMQKSMIHIKNIIIIVIYLPHNVNTVVIKEGPVVVCLQSIHKL